MKRVIGKYLSFEGDGNVFEVKALKAGKFLLERVDNPHRTLLITEDALNNDWDWAFEYNGELTCYTTADLIKSREIWNDA